MCATCGCGHDDTTITALSASGHDHAHPHDHPHDHAHPATETISLEQKVLAKNDLVAEHNRQWLAERAILALNVTSSPGAGKTTLLERTIRDLGADRPIAVIEGDQETLLDAERIQAAAGSQFTLLPAAAWVNCVAVTNSGRMSFGTWVSLSSAFCTSGRITTY